MDSLDLKDIHLPDSIGWWPPAPGWWLLLLASILVLFAARIIFRRLTAKTAIKHAQKLLKQLRQQPDDKLETLTTLSALLRRTAISTTTRSEVAGLRGQAWLEYLDHCLPDAPFSKGVGRCLADAHYQKSEPDEVDFEALFNLCERWLKQQGKKS
ncbi:hypothetical protein A1359_06185 [Methylomonas lenta]|uniref:DUF4381 domain-containing protein n=1 Tax=Methylomonas lenta TaxID=980561 RepID=A0A177NGM6_9GAMM|nr:DUF4381 domain-containing protein [Methylomonas lenta]OAI17256.1 hypothetical protein A1359_06185 [Methylomonas lenta]